MNQTVAAEGHAPRHAGVGKMLLKIGPSRLIRPVTGLLAILLLTRYMGPDRYGAFTLVIQTILLADSFLFAWAGHSALRFRIPMEADQQTFFSTLFLGQLLGLTVLIAMAAVGYFWMPREYANYVWLGIPLVFLGSVSRVLQQSALATHRTLEFTLVELGNQGIRSILAVVAVILLAGSIQGYLAVSVGGLLILCLLQGQSARFFSNLSLRRLDMRVVRRMLAFGLPLIVVTLANQFRLSGDRYIIGFFRSEHEVGLYSAAMMIGAMPMGLVQEVVLMGLYPLAVRAYESSVGEAVTVIESGLRYFALLAVPAVCFLGGFSKSIIVLISGKEYVASWPTLSLAALATMFYSLAQYYTLPFLLENKSWKMIITNGAGSIATIAMILVMVPWLGYQGAALGSVLGAMILLGVSVYMSRRILHIRFPVKSLLRCSLAGLMIVAAGAGSHLWAAQLWQAGLWALGGVVLAGTSLLVTGEMWTIVRACRQPALEEKKN